MVYDGDVIAEGALGSEVSLHSPTTGQALAAGRLYLFHTGTADRVVTIWLQKASGTKRIIAKPTIGPSAGQYSYIIPGIVMGASDDLRGSQDSGTDITFVLSGGAGQ